MPEDSFIGKDFRYIGLGKTLDAVIRLAAFSQDKSLIQLKTYLVQELIQTADQDGYIGVFLPGERFRRLWDFHEQGYIVAALMHGPVVFCFNLFRNMYDYRLSQSYRYLNNVANIVIEPLSLSEPEKDTLIRPDGLNVLLKTTQDQELMFTEFADPGGQKVYFKLSEPSVAVNDPLFTD